MNSAEAAIAHHENPVARPGFGGDVGEGHIGKNAAVPLNDGVSLKMMPAVLGLLSDSRTVADLAGLLAVKQDRKERLRRTLRG